MSENRELESVTEQLLHAFEELDLLHSVCEILSSSHDPDEANKHILCEAMATLGADAGWLVYDDGRSGRQVLRQGIEARTTAAVNDAVVHDAIKSGKHVWTDDLTKDIGAAQAGVLKAFLCVPLKTRNETLGAICLAKSGGGPVFTAGDLKLVQILCAPAANAILHRRAERVSELKRYVSPQLADSLLGGGAIELRNKRAELTMFLAELKGFTESGEEIEPEELVDVLNQYLSAMTDIVFLHDGTLDKFVVGSIFGFFGDPIAQEDHAARAVNMAIMMQQTFADLQVKWRADGYKPFGLGIGINTGYVTVGHVGSTNRTDYTAIGKNVTIAAKLAAAAEHGQILIGQRTFSKLKGSVRAKATSSRDISRQPISVFEVEYERPNVPSQPSVNSVEWRPTSGARDRVPIVAGATISHYQVVGKIGQGGMGEVYQAQDLKLDRMVALKLLPAGNQADDAGRRFVREARALSALNHPNIATIYEIDEHRGVSFIAMEYIRGRTLTDLIAAAPLSPLRILDVSIPMAEALASAHDKNIIHRDIKPTNVMMSDEGFVKVLDFGLAKLVSSGPEEEVGLTRLEPSLTQAGTVFGTVSYMSPEQAMGTSLDQRSDIFSFGVVLFELITSQRPFDGPHPAATMRAVIFDPPPPVSRLRPEAAGALEQIVNKTLQKKPADRYQTMRETLADLKRLRSILTV